MYTFRTQREPGTRHEIFGEKEERAGKSAQRAAAALKCNDKSRMTKGRTALEMATFSRDESTSEAKPNEAARIFFVSALLSSVPSSTGL